MYTVGTKDQYSYEAKRRLSQIGMAPAHVWEVLRVSKMGEVQLVLEKLTKKLLLVRAWTHMTNIVEVQRNPVKEAHLILQ